MSSAHLAINPQIWLFEVTAAIIHASPVIKHREGLQLSQGFTSWGPRETFQPESALCTPSYTSSQNVGGATEPVSAAAFTWFRRKEKQASVSGLTPPILFAQLDVHGVQDPLYVPAGPHHFFTLGVSARRQCERAYVWQHSVIWIQATWATAAGSGITALLRKVEAGQWQGQHYRIYHTHICISLDLKFDHNQKFQVIPHSALLLTATNYDFNSVSLWLPLG